MKRLFAFGAFMLLFVGFHTPLAAGFSGYGCGTMCLASMNSFCPSCGPMTGGYFNTYTPWAPRPPMWWQTGPMMYSNFYSPGPWSYGPTYPGLMPSYFPGVTHVGAGKPNLYLQGKPGTAVSVKMSFEEGGNWLASVPSHGKQGWKGVLAEKNRIQTDQGTYSFLFSDYRVNGLSFQEQKGFCSPREGVVGKMAMTLHKAGFTAREIADFVEYWSVKLPPSKSFCVYPQDERQLNSVAPLEITPKPVAVRRVLFVVQVEEGLNASGARFSQAPKQSWSPQPLRMPASDSEGLVAREWGVAFMFAPAKSN
ncbi:MAG: hypothetical protein A2X94_11715 [Bdellovibrionales bacterium GWB1_55_8]|nr:MAG: hypothetical protein A2X94_11715 [Bdellovibrionales bacterium GWB1_55_8]